ncbi:ABC transporter ATP-binding protein [Microlunatus soli]|uniref:ABC-2 type transport system ATP-binding protein n=1 Tax=Microlunatus soli TaxID=630515 RepID=A0A1H1QSN1_9ACTN|nr:ABC transporter ATP-binding protein [Microlunatus soli]SDS25889.1 ABC-2 type transport system ATP-binding protein [Microlunatus soli]
MADSLVIDVQDLTKRYGSALALDGLSLEVREGEIHGFLGPNGAGKSTTIRTLLGLQRADGGTARLFGRDAWKEASQLHRRISYVPGDVALWPNLTGGEVIDLICRLRGNQDPGRRRALIELFELDPRKRSGTYSKGNRQKVAIIAALASRSDLFIFDEPTSGLDPLMEARFQQAVRDVCGDGATVLLSSHILSEVNALCDRVTIIRAGRVADSAPIDRLRHLGQVMVDVELTAPATDEPAVEKPGLSVDGTHVSGELDTAELDEFLRSCTRIGIREISIQPPSLEQVFLRHYDQGRLPTGRDDSVREASRV